MTSSRVSLTDELWPLEEGEESNKAAKKKTMEHDEAQ
jgi:hypothetical protein